MDKGNKSCEDAFNETGNTTLRNLLLPEALEAYDKVDEIDPESCRAWLKNSTVLFEMGRYDDALASINRSLETDLRMPMPWIGPFSWQQASSMPGKSCGCRGDIGLEDAITDNG
jgi:tetratricopeptide (TPR) repeat protein